VLALRSILDAHNTNKKATLNDHAVTGSSLERRHVPWSRVDISTHSPFSNLAVHVGSFFLRLLRT
jgi:hypothetical protein